MRYNPRAYFCLFFVLLLSFITAPAFAQGNAASVFEGAVDQINCETIRFIHREAGRSEVANNMECLSFESILKSIPEDEASTTAKLAKDINAIKSKYKADKDLGAQLDAAISVATKKIESKPRKQNVPDFKTRLATIKADAIKNAAALANGGEADDAPANEANNAPATDNNTTANTADNDNDGSITIVPDGEESTPAESSKGGMDWLGLLSLIVALLALGLAGYGMMRKPSAKTSANVYKPSGDENVYREKDDSSALAVKNLETRMNQEISRIRAEFDEKLAAITASTGYTEPESMPEPEPVYEISDNVPSLSDAMVETMDLPLEPQAMEEIEEHAPHTTEEPALVTANNNPAPEPEPTVAETAVMEEEPEMEEAPFEEEEKEPAQFEITSEEIANAPGEPDLSLFHAAAESAFAPKQEDAFTDVAEEDEEGLPFYRYVGMPSAQGSFADSNLSETAGMDSVYEVELYDDVPNKAFFSPLPYPEVVAKVLSDPAQYLAPCCTYSEDPTGKHHIIVVEEGTLRKQDDQWMVHDKAKIRFA